MTARKRQLGALVDAPEGSTITRPDGSTVTSSGGAYVLDTLGTHDVAGTEYQAVEPE